MERKLRKVPQPDRILLMGAKKPNNSNLTQRGLGVCRTNFRYGSLLPNSNVVLAEIESSSQREVPAVGHVLVACICAEVREEHYFARRSYRKVFIEASIALTTRLGREIQGALMGERGSRAKASHSCKSPGNLSRMSLKIAEKRLWIA